MRYIDCIIPFKKGSEEENLMADFKVTSSIYSTLIIIGGLVGIVSVFMAWLDVDRTGWEIINNPIYGSIADSYIQWMPLVVLIIAFNGLFAGLTALIRPRKGIGAGAIVCGILMIVAAVLFFIHDKPILTDNGAGVYLAMVAGVLLVIFGALRMSVK
jgi:uncharacterized membrane protein (UPF0136 family)